MFDIKTKRKKKTLLEKKKMLVTTLRRFQKLFLLFTVVKTTEISGRGLIVE